MRKLVIAAALALVLTAPALAAAPGVPDLIVVPLLYNTYITTETFAAGDCAVDEGAITAGTHKLLRFATETANVGTGDLKLGKPSASDPRWEYFVCHGHWHFKNYADYSLLDANGVVVGVGHKQSFCIEDSGIWDPALTNRTRPFYTCDRQGISRGWYDLYDSGLVGQWIEIDNVPPGTYTLVQTVNPVGAIVESNYSNNTLYTTVTIP